MQVIRTGITRTVILTRKRAYKFPTLRYGWGKFLRGLLSNMEEATFSPLAHHFKLCPVLWAIPGGWLTVMPRCEPLTDDEWSSVEHLWQPGASDWNGLSCDFKRDNMGTFDGGIVLLDYGDLT